MAGSSAGRLLSGEYKYPFHQLVWGLVKKTAKIIGIAALLGLLVYSAIVATVARYVYVYDDSGSGGGYVLTRDPDTDVPAPGTQVVFDAANVSKDQPGLLDSLGGKFQLATLPPRSISIGAIEAGPTGKMVFDDNNRVSVNGRQTGLVLDDKDKPVWSDQYLVNQFIVKCLAGDCKPGVSYLVSSNAIDGQIDEKSKVDDVAAVIPNVKEHSTAATDGSAQ